MAGDMFEGVPLSPRARQVAGQLGLSCDLRDYIAFFPERPARAERDRLESKARQDPSFARRVAIWDFFFLPTLEEVRNLFAQTAQKLGMSTPTPLDKYKNAEEEIRARFRAARDRAERDSRSKEEEEINALRRARDAAVQRLQEWMYGGGLSCFWGSSSSGS
jgi:hypothetical protein